MPCCTGTPEVLCMVYKITTFCYIKCHGKNKVRRQIDRPQMLCVWTAQLLHAQEQEIGGTEDRAQEILRMVPEADEAQGGENNGKVICPNSNHHNHFSYKRLICYNGNSFLAPFLLRISCAACLHIEKFSNLFLARNIL